MTTTWTTRVTSVRSALFHLMVVCVGGFVGMGMGVLVLGFGKLDRGVSAAKITIGGV